MATRSLLCRKLANGKYRTIYCHWDGYPSHQAPRLVEGFNTPAKVTQLFKLGDLSKLGYSVGKKHPFNEGSDPAYRDFCTAYGRDRGEMGCESILVEGHEGIRKQADNCGAEYVYLWNGTEWVYSTDQLSPGDVFAFDTCRNFLATATKKD